MASSIPRFSPKRVTAVDPLRVRTLKDAPIEKSGPIVYWMGRDLRLHDNWALRHAQELAIAHKKTLLVLYVYLPPRDPVARRQQTFLLEGLQSMAKDAKERDIALSVVHGGEERDLVPRILTDIDASILVMDVPVLREARASRLAVASSSTIPVIEVDAHNIVPVWVASEKREYAAYTIRPRIHRNIHRFLTAFPEETVGVPAYQRTTQAWDDIRASIERIPEHPLYEKKFKGTTEGLAEVIDRFFAERFAHYAEERNDPVAERQSDLSPYLHFGFLAPQRLALDVMTRSERASRDDLMEELIVRRELADNMCFYDTKYDSTEGFPAWAKKTLEEHKNDGREHLYDFDAFRDGKTHDALWNAAQHQILKSGKIHGYMRMYWAKKILEWTRSPEEALSVAIRLNDGYSLDGTDPNGYAGIAWSIGGVHDRAWFPREIFGLIRYMSSGGAKGKFDVDAYVRRWSTV
jgi:deoxyribodipyrimidine photo-lyase